MELDYRQVLDAFSDGVVASDQHHRIVYANRAVEAMLGWAAGALLGQPLTVLMPARMRGAHSAGFARFVATHQPRIVGRPVRVPAIRRDGTELEVELTLTTFRVDRDGAPGDLIVAALRDLRDRVELERQQATNRRIQALYDVMRALVASQDAAEGVARVLAVAGAALDWEAGAYWTPDGEGALRPFAVWARDPSLRSGFLQRLRAVTLRPGLGLPGRVWEAGRPAWVPDFAREPTFPRAPIAAEHGLHGAFAFAVQTQEGLQGVFEFFSPQVREPDEELLRATDSMGGYVGQFLQRLGVEAQLREAVRARDEFLSIASHELKTPLTSLDLQVSSLARAAGGAAVGPVPGARVVQKLEAIDRQVGRLSGLIERLLDVSRIVGGQLQLVTEPLDLRGVVEDVASRFREQLERAGCTLDLRLADAPGEWDRMRLEQVVTNLLGNAVKYGAGKPVHVTLEQRAGDAHAVLRVRDEGIGIPPEHQARIFERFERAVSARHFGGLGLGLWIVRQIVTAMGGTIAVQSEAGRGSEFVVSLPPRPPLPEPPGLA